MITNFEEQTKPLSKEEQEKMVPELVQLFEARKGLRQAIRNRALITFLSIVGYDTKPDRVRKMINFIRVNCLVKNLIASNLGYYVSNDEKEIQNYVLSLYQRARAIIAVGESFTKTKEENAEAED